MRGTTRHQRRLAAIEAAGAEGVLGDPDRLSTLTAHLEGVSALLWLMGGATGTAEQVAAVHGPRLQSMVEALIDTPVRGVVYEAAGSAGPAALGRGAEVVRAVSSTNRMPAEIVHIDPGDTEAWTGEMAAAFEQVLAA